MRAGAAEVIITPPLGVELVGYGPDLDRRSDAIHAHLKAQALVLDDGRTAAAIVTCDLLALTEGFVARVREGIEAATGIPAAHVLIACSHSHTSPSTGSTRGWGRADEPYVHMLVRHLVGAAAWAKAGQEAVRLQVGRDRYEGLAWNRVDGEVVDPDVHTIHATNEDGEVVWILVQHACHPVIFGPSTAISPDFPGALRSHLQEAYPSAVVAFVNGACGDVDPVTNREVWGKGTADDVDRHGRELAQSARKAVEGAEPIVDPKVDVRTVAMRLAYDLPDPADLRAEIERLEGEVEARGSDGDAPFGAVSEAADMPGFWLSYHRDLEARMRRGEIGDGETVELQRIALGDATALLAIPAEVYVRQGLAIKARSPFVTTLPVCYANGSCGYLPPREEYAKQSYTTGLAAAVFDRPPFTPDVAERLLEAAGRALPTRGEAADGPNG